MNQLKDLFSAYSAAVFEKDVPAFLGLYHSEFIGFDLWKDWLKTPESWRLIVNDWFSSLKTERVRVEFFDVREIVTQEIATAHAFARYEAVSSDGEYLRHLHNRLTWVAKKEQGAWKIIHEHTSAPIDPQTCKAMLHK
jgi:ketosteroid isomerase-like protein